MTKEQPASDGTVVFGLTREELWPIAEEIAGEAVRRLDIRVAHRVEGHYGYQAEKVVPTFCYVTDSGRTGETVVFAKRFHEPGPREAHHYAQLARCGAPVARLYGSLADAKGREILFLEFLRGTGQLLPFDGFVSDASIFLPFLALAARFNALQPREEYRALLHVQTAEHLARWLGNAAAALGRVWEMAPRGELGDELADLCREARGKLPALQKLTEDLIAPVAEMRRGLVHGDYYPDQALRREATGELVLVDLEGVGLRPRFADVARWVGAPDAAQPRCLLQSELARHYLDSYRRWGGADVPLSEFLEETRVLALADDLMMLPFSLHRSLDGEGDWTGDRDEVRRVFRGDLHRKLSALLHMLP